MGSNTVADDKKTRLPPGASTYDFSDREKEILELLARGWTAREAANEVDLGVRTVERYIENLRLKLHARNTTHLITRAYSERVLKIVRGVARVA